MNIYTAIIPLKEKRILLFKKKDKAVRTIPFVEIDGEKSRIQTAISQVKHTLGIIVNKEKLVHPLIVNKVNKLKKGSLGYFALSIDRQGELINKQQDFYSHYERFALDDIPTDVTADLKKILTALLSWKKMLELN